MRLAVIWHRLGPYHLARLQATAVRAELTAIEMSGEDETNAWEKIAGGDGFRRVTVFPTCDCDTRPRAEVVERLGATLDEARPEVVAIPSWGTSYALAALDWSLRTRTPNVCMTESNQYDRSRKWWVEWVKRRVVRLFQAGFASSEDHRAYFEFLGIKRERVFLGYNVVDNDHFARGAAGARRDAAGLRSELGLPEHYFLASARFVEKKNLARLAEAFVRYRELAGKAAWGLVLLGDGALRPQLEQRRDALGLGAHLHMPGFKQYNDLPAYYGLAGAFILPSTEEQWGLVVNEAMACGLAVLVSKRCGCARTLVRNGVNGFTFDPFDARGLGKLMLKLSCGEAGVAEMGRASREIIARWTPGRFAENLVKAAECALSQPKRRAGLLDRLLLSALTRTR
jgi:glycosyltransferase involved in cell wall biosynthesis